MVENRLNTPFPGHVENWLNATETNSRKMLRNRSTVLDAEDEGRIMDVELSLYSKEGSVAQ